MVGSVVRCGVVIAHACASIVLCVHATALVSRVFHMFAGQACSFHHFLLHIMVVVCIPQVI